MDGVGSLFHRGDYFSGLNANTTAGGSWSGRRACGLPLLATVVAARLH
jgi:hypothetical protein